MRQYCALSIVYARQAFVVKVRKYAETGYITADWNYVCWIVLCAVKCNWTVLHHRKGS